MFQLFSILFAGIPCSTAVDLSHFIGDSTGASQVIAATIMRVVDWVLGIFGLDHNQTIVTFLYAAVVFGVACVVGWIVQFIVYHAVRVVAKRWNNDTYQELRDVNFFQKACRMIPALVFLILIQFTLSAHNSLSSWLSRITWIYVVYVTAAAFAALINGVWKHVDSHENKRKLPLKGLAQLAKGIVWLIAAIVIVAIIVDKSPGSLLAGLGAFSAVLMLIFKDNILGLVAGLQLSENDSLHVGDWIAVKGTDANGTVQEVTLTSVKVLNWDKTTTTLPPYSLVSGSFTNYRTMQKSNTRRICRSFMIDADSVLPATPEMLKNIAAIPLMKDYIAKKIEQRAAGKVADVNNPAGLPDGTIDTNLGLFRAYMKLWLDNNDDISHVDTCFVSTLPQTATGIPFQVYCFTNTSQWLPYEAIQDSVFEHLAAMLSAFQLYTFENPSGRDTVVDGFLSPGGDIDQVFGVPYPFFQNPDAPDSPRSTRDFDRTPLKAADSLKPAPVSPSAKPAGDGKDN
ncbi:MAG: mechanosensitive ion channel family protein [Odoribacter sp.]|nr:mechanosensitive ion channel family protein [Odoribacter sp.]